MELYMMEFTKQIMPTLSYINHHHESPQSNIICNTHFSNTNNETKFIIHDEANLVNCPFSHNKLWYHKRLLKTEDLPLLRIHYGHEEDPCMDIQLVTHAEVIFKETT